MAIERTLSIIKPDAVGKNVIGKIISRFEDNQLTMVAGKLIHLSDEMASGFYVEHEGKQFHSGIKNKLNVSSLLGKRFRRSSNPDDKHIHLLKVCYFTICL